MSDIKEIKAEEIKTAYERVAGHIHKTPVLTSSLLNSWLRHDIYFKAEMFQKTGAFKARGALNALLRLKEEGKLPKHVVAYSSGNHAQGVAWATAKLNIKCTIFLPKNTSPVKIQATRSYGPEVVLTENRIEAEKIAGIEVANGALLLPPFDHDYVIAGQGTCCYEVLKDGLNLDAVFVPCGGGGLSSGTYLATKLLSPDTKVFAVEPEIANDAARSVKSGKLFRFSQTPMSIGDGTRTLSLSERTFHYIKKIAGVYEIPEKEIKYWAQWINHLLKVTCEPSSALSLAGAFHWLKGQNERKKVLIILSGGNISDETYREIWQVNYLNKLPDFSLVL